MTLRIVFMSKKLTKWTIFILSYDQSRCFTGRVTITVWLPELKIWQVNQLMLVYIQLYPLLL